MNSSLRGSSQPLTGPLYAEAPFHYRGAQFVIVAFEADDEAVAAHLPPGVALDGPARCQAWMGAYPFTTLGAFNEAIVFVHVRFDGEPYIYCPFIYVDSDVPLCAGRELWGFPKKLAQIALEQARDELCGLVERPEGRVLMTVGLRPERLAAPEELGPMPPILTWRYIPGAESGSPPSISELVRTDVEVTIHRGVDGSPSLFAGPAAVALTGSATDPLSDLAPTRVLGGYLMTVDVVLPCGTVVENYLAEASKVEAVAAGA